MKKKLNPLLHNELRVSIISLLVSTEGADFNYLLEKTGATKGNLSVQISKLNDAGYIEVEKSFKNNYPHTFCTVTKKGIDEFDEYVKELKKILNI